MSSVNPTEDHVPNHSWNCPNWFAKRAFRLSRQNRLMLGYRNVKDMYAMCICIVLSTFSYRDIEGLATSCDDDPCPSDPRF